LFDLLEMSNKHGLKRVYVLSFLDGRDVGQSSALGFIEESERRFEEIGIGEFATVSGRYYAMDRDKRWDRGEPAYHAISNGRGPVFDSAAEGVQASYDEEVYDEVVVPVVVKGCEGRGGPAPF